MNVNRCLRQNVTAALRVPRLRARRAYLDGRLYDSPAPILIAHYGDAIRTYRRLILNAAGS